MVALDGASRDYCGDHSNRFWEAGDIGPCWKTLVFASPFGVYLAWWGVGSFFLTRSRHPPVLGITELSALDYFRALLCMLLAIEAPLMLWFIKSEPQPHEYVDVFGASFAQWFFLCVLVISTGRRATKDTSVMKIASALAFFSKALLCQSVLNSGKEDYGEDDLRKSWMLGSFVLTVIASFFMTCVARDYRKLQRYILAKSKPQTGSSSLQEALLGGPDEINKPVQIQEHLSPEEYVGLFSQLTFSWLSELMRLGYVRPLTHADLYDIRSDDASERLYQKLSASLRHHKSLVRSLYDSGTLSPFLWAAPLKFVYDTLLYTGPATLLRAFIEFLGEEPDPSTEWYESRGTKLALAMFIVAAIQTFTLHVYFNLVFRAGMRVRTALVTTIFNKTLKLSLSSRNAHSSGALANLVSTDAQRMQDLFPYLHVVWSAPLQIILCTYFLWRELRWAAIIALATVVFAIFFLTGLVASRLKAMSQELMSSKDARVRAMTEALSTMKLLKLYGWETIYKDKIINARDRELNLLRRYSLLTAMTRVLWSGTPIIVTLVTFGSFVALGGELDAATAFVSVTLLQLLRFPMAMLPTMFNGAIEANVSLRRIEDFLNMNELRSIADEEPISAVSSRRSSLDDMVIVSKRNSASLATTVGSGPRPAVPRVPSEEWRNQLMSPYPTMGKVAPSVGVGGPALEMVAGTYYWDDAREKVAVSDINLRLNDGEICIVTGEVGSGKTALLLALLGELVPDAISLPFVSINGSVALAPQVPWIRNATVKDNILYDQPFDIEWYAQVIEACALGPDLKQLPAGDLTEIGEKGINLSGGQKARVSLARAVYSRSDLLLLESCFEAVDEHVASILWQKCFFGILKKVPSRSGRKRTVLVVTHSAKDEAEQVDKVIVMAEGRILASGSPGELSNNATYRNLKRVGKAGTVHPGEAAPNGSSGAVVLPGVTSAESEPKTIASSANAAPPVTVPTSTPASGAKLIVEEKSTRRGVDGRVYYMYVRSLGGWPVIFCLVGFSLLRMAADISTSRWLAHWSNDVEKGRADEKGLDYYLGIYAGLSAVALVFVSVAMITIYLCSLTASRWYHSRLLESIMRAPMSFFDSTPLGRITQRFTKDMNTLDSVMGNLLSTWISTGIDVLGTIVVVAMVSPYFLVPFPLLAAGYVLTQRYYVRTSRELKNLDSISLSPIFSHFQETLEGCVSVRAYRQVDEAVNTNFVKLDKNLSAYYMSNSCNRWLAVRMEFVGNTLVFLASILNAARHGHVNAAMAGMAVSYTLTVTQTLNWFVRMTSDFETNIVSVERIDEYAHGIDPEAPLVTSHEPSPQWPTKGEIVLTNVFARYRKDLDDVLQGVSFAVPAGSHVGVCGKTGCGKSTLFLVLLRIVEARSGTIIIDGVNVQEIGLKRLRESVSIIPQDAVLFHTTLRYNLDPTGKKSDAEIWRALDICELSDFVKRSLAAGASDATKSPLDSIVAEGGADFSFGQRQLVCIARALLRDTTILLSDEASSGIDRMTDSKIQDMIKREFAKRTTLTIAHRLETIMGSDLIAYMEMGRVVEFDDPKLLLADSGSRFFRLANDLAEKNSPK